MQTPNVEFSLDPEQVLEDHHYNPMKNAFRLKVILDAADVLFDYEHNGSRTQLIAKIADQDDPNNLDVYLFGTQQEYDSYLEACGSASGTGWAVHVANGCERRYQQNMRAYLDTRAHDHDHVYWYKHYMQKHLQVISD